ncbi:MAG: hypothetical protein R2825_30705 [Saprospiraceae bacterium]
MKLNHESMGVSQFPNLDFSNKKIKHLSIYNNHIEILPEELWELETIKNIEY